MGGYIPGTCGSAKLLSVCGPFQSPPGVSVNICSEFGPFLKLLGADQSNKYPNGDLSLETLGCGSVKQLSDVGSFWKRLGADQ